MFKIKFVTLQEVYDFMLDFYMITGIEITNHCHKNPFISYWDDVQKFSL